MYVKTNGKSRSFIYKGGDRMNFLRICRYLYTKKLFGEIVLFIQLICMLEMSFVVLKPVDSYLMEKKQLKAAYVSDLDSMVHFSKNNLIYEQEMKGNRAAAQEIYKLLLEADDVEKVDRCAFENGTYIKTDGKMSSANLVLYSSEMLDVIRLNTESAALKNVSEGYVPILVSSSMAEELPVGTRTEISLAFDDTIKISCEVAGILQTVQFRWFLVTEIPWNWGIWQFCQRLCQNTNLLYLLRIWMNCLTN